MSQRRHKMFGHALVPKMGCTCGITVPGAPVRWADSKAWYRGHYDEVWRTRGADPENLTVADRFWAMVEKTEVCWIWRGFIDPNEYGRFTDDAQTYGGIRVDRAHRWAYQNQVGPIPEGYVIDHLCRNRRCVRPDHLDAVPQRVNVFRGNSDLATKMRQTHCKRGHAFSPENTYHPPYSPRSRRCRACAKAKNPVSALRVANLKVDDSKGAE